VNPGCPETSTIACFASDAPLRSHKFQVSSDFRTSADIQPDPYLPYVSIFLFH